MLKIVRKEVRDVRIIFEKENIEYSPLGESGNSCCFEKFKYNYVQSIEKLAVTTAFISFSKLEVSYIP